MLIDIHDKCAPDRQHWRSDLFTESKIKISGNPMTEVGIYCKYKLRSMLRNVFDSARGRTIFDLLVGFVE